jgi:hypothetical protein
MNHLRITEIVECQTRDQHVTVVTLENGSGATIFRIFVGLPGLAVEPRRVAQD